MDCIYLGQKVCLGYLFLGLLADRLPSLVVPWFVAFHYDDVKRLTWRTVVRHMVSNIDVGNTAYIDECILVQGTGAGTVSCLVLIGAMFDWLGF